MGRTVAKCRHRQLADGASHVMSRSLTSLQQDSTIIAIIEMSQSSWLVAGIVPGIERHPLKELEPSEEQLIRLRAIERVGSITPRPILNGLHDPILPRLTFGNRMSFWVHTRARCAAAPVTCARIFGPPIS
jgi:phenylpyruvate tautomerase PptA (4-oxalocrotonate tautomerase family)